MKTAPNIKIPKLYTIEAVTEIAQIAAIMSDHILQELYGTMNSGYIDTTHKIAEWAVEFFGLHCDTNWEDTLEAGIKPLSKKMSSVICWDDAVMDYAYYKLEALKKL